LSTHGRPRIPQIRAANGGYSHEQIINRKEAQVKAQPAAGCALAASTATMRCRDPPVKGECPLWRTLLVVQEQFDLSTRAATVAVAVAVACEVAVAVAVAVARAATVAVALDVPRSDS
jgi:hypothetical protein